ncbi:3-oxoacyl-[acyl-carrier protein] reductase [Granulicella aggregans]|uniref:3-oxoacyl-[acyl-carrier protein] reductase n=1 Tax=Granulicella aggregans TaxID=474949 RepID=A0A7W7ZJJ3_9BACT|nr:SDR family oxidoreductase [Granulicella aggregans]MBB5061110.1 3-oxoacyl-[acyl-carrier protein] reductase [Granulicella aggregans]
MSSISGSLKGKIALVTGGSRGIGAGIVRRLASDGVSVAFTYLSAEEKAYALVAEVRADGGTALAIKADNASESDIRNAVREATETFGGLDIFVSNAGQLLIKELGQIQTDELDRMLAVNVRAIVIGTQAAAAVMKSGGRIMTIGSVSGVRTGVGGGSVYSMTKAALGGFVRGAAIDLAPRAITVNNIQPGPTATDMNPAEGPHVDWLTKLIPLGRFGKDREIASLIAYLATEDAAFITGASLTVDGGYTA